MNARFSCSALRRTFTWGWRVLLLALLWAVWRIALAPVTSNEPDWFENADKVRHMGAFFTFWCVGVQGFERRHWPGLAVALLGYGAAIEIAQQMLTTDRDASWADGLADAVGLALGWVVQHLSRLGMQQFSPPTT